MYKFFLTASVAFITMTTLPAAAADASVRTVTFVNAKGGNAGTATLTEGPAGVLIHLDLKNLPPGSHAMHIHGKGACTPAGSFTDAGDHLSPSGHLHGAMMEGGAHEGDMANIFIAPDGTLQEDVINPAITFDPAMTNRALLNDKDGAALVIHAGVDDYKSQPSGASGDRIACAVIK